MVVREDAKTLVQLRKYKEQPVQEAEARKLAQSLGKLWIRICMDPHSMSESGSTEVKN